VVLCYQNQKQLKKHVQSCLCISAGPSKSFVATQINFITPLAPCQRLFHGVYKNAYLRKSIYVLQTIYPVYLITTVLVSANINSCVNKHPFYTPQFELNFASVHAWKTHFAFCKWNHVSRFNRILHAPQIEVVFFHQIFVERRGLFVVETRRKSVEEDEMFVNTAA
jgi:hypothetical protein